MNAHQTLMIAASALALAMITGTAVLAESQTPQDQTAEAQAFLSSPTSLSQAIVAAEAAGGGKVASIEYQSGENGAPDLIMATVILADGTEKTVALNPADGKVMNVTVASNDTNDAGSQGETGGEADGGNDGENANN